MEMARRTGGKPSAPDACERIRQIEVRAFEKVQKAVKKAAEVAEASPRVH